MPAILDSLFHKVVNTTSTPIGVEGGGWWVAMKWQGVPVQKLFYGQMASIQAVFSSTRFKNVATLMPSLTSQSCGDSLPSVCLAGQVEAINRPPEHPWMPDRPVNEASVKADR